MGERGVAPYLTFDQVRACHRLYMAGESIRSIARQIHPRTRYASVASCANGLHQQFVLLGLPRRDRIAASVAASTIHGLSRRGQRDRDHRRAQRRASGDILDRPPCAGVRVQYPRKGAPCQRPAQVGSDYCIAHDPTRAEERAERLRRAREAA